MSESEQILDPEAARLAARIRRLMLISGATTVVAVCAVFGVIGYRVFKGEGSVPVTDVTATLPKGARIIHTAATGDRIAITIQHGDNIEIRTFDPYTLQATGRLRFASEP